MGPSIAFNVPPLFPLSHSPESATMRALRSQNKGWDPRETRQEAISYQSLVSDAILEVNSSHDEMSVYVSL